MQYSNKNKIINIKKINKKYNETSDAVIYLDGAYGVNYENGGEKCINCSNGCIGGGHSGGGKCR